MSALVQMQLMIEQKRILQAKARTNFAEKELATKYRKQRNRHLLYLAAFVAIAYWFLFPLYMRWEYPEPAKQATVVSKSEMSPKPPAVIKSSPEQRRKPNA